jgi:cobalt/nickel transport system permease protein
LRHIAVEKWSRGNSGLHRRDARAKLFVLAVFLVTVATASRGLPVLAGLLFAVLWAALVWARLPVIAVLLRAGIVFSFTLPFALISVMTGDSGRAGALLFKSYLSSLAVLVLVSTTPISLLLRGMEAAGAPRFLLMVAQVLYRYLFVISEEARHMRTAAVARGGAATGRMARSVRFQAAAGALGALFARSYVRAEDIHRAMLSRGFTGHFPAAEDLRFRGADGLFALLAGSLPVFARLAAERFA